MLQVNDTPSGAFKITNIRRRGTKQEAAENVCSIDPDEATGKPPC